MQQTKTQILKINQKDIEELSELGYTVVCIENRNRRYRISMRTRELDVTELKGKFDIEQINYIYHERSEVEYIALIVKAIS